MSKSTSAISIRQMTIDDVPLGMRLKSQAGWNQNVADWQRLLQLEPDGCFVAQRQGQPVATTTTCVFGSVAWIAMVLVDQRYRHQGIGSRLVENALSYLRQRSVTTIRLDATRFGQPVYQRLGFVNDFELIRFAGRAMDGQRATKERVSTEALKDVQHLDRCATGTERSRLITYLAHEHPEYIRVETVNGTPCGYAMLRPGEYAIQIGPVAALNQNTGQQLCDWACGQVASQPILVDIPVQNHAAIQWAHARRLVEQRRFMRMHLGDPVDDQPDTLWASSGAEKG